MPRPTPQQPELIIITGLSGSGKGTVLRALEDLGYYAVDNLPVDIIPHFAELTHDSPNIRRAALVVDIREGAQLKRFPALLRRLRRTVPTRLVFLDADDATLQRRYSETRRPHPVRGGAVLASIRSERRMLAPIRALADHIIPTAGMNIHQLRAKVNEQFGGAPSAAPIRIDVVSFGFRHGVPAESDLVFDVRFLPNPNYIPAFKNKTGKHKGVARYVAAHPQTQEFLTRTAELLRFLLPHYVAEGKSYLTISIGCTGGHHRSVMMAEEIAARLAKLGYPVRTSHRDIKK